jgi:hypothetical protein
VSNRLDTFPAFLLERVRYARSKGIYHFSLTHPTGDQLEVKVTGPMRDQIEVIRYPKVNVPTPIRGFKPEALPRMRLATTERMLVHDMREGITSHQAEDWRG